MRDGEIYFGVEAVLCQIKQTVATLSRKLIFLASVKLHSELKSGRNVESIKIDEGSTPIETGGRNPLRTKHERQTLSNISRMLKQWLSLLINSH